MKERRYDVDWLRVLLILIVFLYHSAQPFRALDGWVVSNPQKSQVVEIICFWAEMWGLPLFFMLSGVGSWYGLRSRSNWHYILERVKRLLVPLYTVGLFILLPISNYIWLRTNRGYNGTFLETFPSYFTKLGGFYLQPLGLLPLPFAGHLWFLQFILLISLITLPLLRFLRSKHGLYLIDLAAGWCQRRGGIFLFLIPLLLIRISLNSVFAGWNSWADFANYLAFFVIGYIFPADPRFNQSIKKPAWFCLILGFSCYAATFFMIEQMGYKFYDETLSLKYLLFQTLYGIGCWSWMLFVLSLAAMYLNFNNKALAYGNEAVLPFYILHEPFVVLIGWYVVQWDIGILPKYLFICVTAFAAIMLVYHFLVRPINLIRFFFGMRPKKKPSAAPARTEGATA